MNKLVLPAIFLSLGLISTTAGLVQGQSWLGGAALTCAGLVMVWWAIPIKWVRLAGDVFLISNFRREVRVPVDHLKSISEWPYSRSPHISMIFSPPTAFGREVRIITPIGFGSREGFEEVAHLLRAIVRKNRVEAAESKSKDASPDVLKIIADFCGDKPGAILALNDAQLDELVDRLPSDSTLRDLARQERVHRWYG